MSTELCRVTTEDGLFLDGVLRHPPHAQDASLPVDCFLLVHGTGSNFYAPGVLEGFARQAVFWGGSVLRINTRGHDRMAAIPGRSSSVRGGAAYETISDCRWDLDAWIHLLTQKGFRKIVLVGHSMGGVKSIYTLAHNSHPQVAGLICLSPPRFSHDHLMSHPDAQNFRADFKRALELVADGRSEELIEVKQPLPLILTAGGFVDKYGPADEYNFLRWLPEITQPTLILVGTQTVQKSMAFEGLPEDMERLVAWVPSLSFQLINGGDMNFANNPQLPFETSMNWLVTTGL